jgi:formylglycine-generating enzyme required for sulfatase activity
MCGGVSEWTADTYDALAYAGVARPPGTAAERVLRGGSWADAAEAVTVSFRMSRGSLSWRAGAWGPHLTPTIGFRLCRVLAQ